MVDWMAGWLALLGRESFLILFNSIVSQSTDKHTHSVHNKTSTKLIKFEFGN